MTKAAQKIIRDIKIEVGEIRITIDQIVIRLNGKEDKK